MNPTRIVFSLFIAFLSYPADGFSTQFGVTDKPEYMNYCDFDRIAVEMSAHPDAVFAVADNPRKEAINPSRKCGMITITRAGRGVITSKPFSRKIDFTKNGYIVSIKVISPVAGADVRLKLEPRFAHDKAPAVEAAARTNNSGVWEEIAFDFTPVKPKSNVYQRVTISFEAGALSEWYFDDIMVPSDDLSDINLLKRYAGNPVLYPEGRGNWRDSHMANAAILQPDESPDGRWWLYIRGSGHDPEYCDQIGLYLQDTTDFKPFGPWEAYPGNPVIRIGKPGTYDDKHLLCCAPVVGKDNVVYLYYLGKRATGPGSLCVQRSTDGGYTFEKAGDQPLRDGTGCSDAIYHDGKYYIYTGDAHYDFEKKKFKGPLSVYVEVSRDPMSIRHAKLHHVLDVGGGPADFDTHAVNSSRIFRLRGVDKWFMTYEGNATHFDFPDRLHVAYSDDLLNWTKVDNDQPFFTRGKPGTWDQGALWYGEVFEHRDTIYMYYEGWGGELEIPNRDKTYFAWGQSRTGAAWVTKNEFLKWCNLPRDGVQPAKSK